jgi:thiol-disulfide isomerase/thioredoxin
MPMMKKVLMVLLALSAMAGGVYTQRWLSVESAKQEALDFNIAFPDLEGKLHSLSEWKGKILIINFWASWCPPCVEEMPEFFILQNQLAAKGVQFLGIVIDDEPDVAREFLKTMPTVTYPMLDGSIGGRQLAAKMGNKSEVLPFSLVFDAQGRRMHVEVGRFSREEVLKQVNRLLSPEG